MDEAYELVVAIVNRSASNKAVEAAIAAGAKGSTIISGRGAGSEAAIHIFGLAVEHEKDLVLVACSTEISGKVADTIDKAIDTSIPGNGIILVLPIKRSLGLGKILPAMK
ncbi:MAG: P-II family nitrogen regulator [Deltaproteobacteria bacterium]|jgi:nitrogen regulatory protein PII|nr:P-II family nitrogen regulator [Deltaproteobacteria bacterium]